MSKTPDKKRVIETENNSSPDKRKKKQKTAPAAGGGGGAAPAANKSKALAGAGSGGAAKPKQPKQSAPKKQAAAADAAPEKTVDADANEVEVDPEVLSSLDVVQEALEHINAKCSYETLLIERKFNREKAPLYKKRAATIASIPFFWLQCFVNHDGIRQVLDEEDISILKHLTTFDVSDLKDPAIGYTITMAFKPNPYFKNQNLSKTYTFEKPAEPTAAAKEDDDDDGANGTVKVSCTPIEWKDQTFVERNPGSFFVQWFDAEAVAQDGEEDPLADAFREDIWKNPLLLYVQALDDGQPQGDEGDDDALEFDAEGAAIAGGASGEDE